MFVYVRIYIYRERERYEDCRGTAVPPSASAARLVAWKILILSIMRAIMIIIITIIIMIIMIIMTIYNMIISITMYTYIHIYVCIERERYYMFVYIYICIYIYIYILKLWAPPRCTYSARGLPEAKRAGFSQRPASVGTPSDNNISNTNNTIV